jgi:PAS domain S-box-containing protein
MPTTRDGERTRQALATAGLACAVCRDVEDLCREINRGAGTALLTEEALAADPDRYLAAALRDQPPWSDFPFVILARGGREDRADPYREAMNVSLVERPVRIRSLLSVVRAALRARRHQYAVRDHLAERARQAEALRAGEERLRRMINVDGVGVFVFALPAGRLIGANDFFLRMSGYTRAEIAAGELTWRTLTPPEYVAETERQLAGLAATGRIGPFETEYFRKDRSRAWMVFAGSALGDGTVVEYGIDVTDRKRAEAALREADRRKDDFIALLAHELRNPLAPIRNGLEVMRLARDFPAPLTRARDRMDRQLTHLVRLVDDLLDVSRINQNKMELRRARISLSEVVASAVETARPLIDDARHELTISLPAAPVFLDADLTRLSQVLSNLLANSARYTPRGGRIWLSAERAGGDVVVAVRDTGIGIPASALENIFDMFSQVNRSAERTAGGLGIGLALVKGLVEMHGGTVSAASDGEDRGSTFTVTLPVATDREAAATEAPRAAPAVGGGRRVLVVDDNRDGADSMAEMLALLGNDVRTAHDGLEAVAEAGRFRPEVILMDVGMPRLNGLDATRRIRGQPWGKDIAIVALTGWGQDRDREQSRRAGCDGHLVKPVALPDLERLFAGLPEGTAGGKV